MSTFNLSQLQSFATKTTTRGAGISTADTLFAQLSQIDAELQAFGQLRHTHDDFTTGKGRTPGITEPGLFRNAKVYPDDRVYLRDADGIRRAEFQTLPAGTFGLLEAVQASADLDTTDVIVFRVNKTGTTKTMLMPAGYAGKLMALAMAASGKTPSAPVVSGDQE